MEKTAKDSGVLPRRKIVVGITGASGTIYAQRLVELLAADGCDLDIVLSPHAREVAELEIGGLTIPEGARVHGDRSMQVPFVSGSNRYDAMVIVPCSMGTLGRIAHGYSDSTITRAADVFLKEKQRLILVPRETPWNLIHARNVVTLLEAGAAVLPAMPSFYGGAATLADLVDTVVARVLDQLGVTHDIVQRWQSEECLRE